MGNAILSALTRRGIDPSGLAPSMQTQLSPSAPGFDPSMQAPNMPPMPDRSPMTMMGQDPQAQFAQSMQQPTPDQSANVTLPVQDNNPQQPGIQVPQPEVQMILDALTARLKHHSKMEAQANQPLPQVPGM